MPNDNVGTERGTRHRDFRYVTDRGEQRRSERAVYIHGTLTVVVTDRGVPLALRPGAFERPGLTLRTVGGTASPFAA